MEAKNIDCLPGHIVKQILQELDLESLKNASLTCKAWLEVSNTIPWYLKMEGAVIAEPSDNDFVSDSDMSSDSDSLSYMLFDSDALHAIKNSSKSFKRVKIRNYFSSQDLLECINILKVHGPNIQELHLKFTTILNADPDNECFRAMPNLTRVVFESISDDAIARRYNPCPIAGLAVPSTKNHLDAPEFKHLKSLDLTVSDSELLDIFRKARLTEFILSDIRYACNQDLLWNFLGTQISLKTMTIDSAFSFGAVFFYQPVNLELIQFKLTRLLILNYGWLLMQPYQSQNFSLFIQHHSETLEYVELGDGFPETIHEVVINKLKALKSLKYSFKRHRADSNFYQRLENNLSVKKLTLVSKYDEGSDKEIIGIMRLFPNITRLEVDYCYGKNVQTFASKHFTKLEELVVTSNITKEEDFSHFNFSNLKKIDIAHVFVQLDWVSITKGNPKVEDLRIHQIHSDRLDIKTILTNWNLHTMIIQRFSPVNLEFRDIIRQHGKNFKLLKFPLRSFFSDLHGIRAFRLSFGQPKPKHT